MQHDRAGWVDTPNERLIQARFGRPDFPAGISNLTTPEEIGASVVHLASVNGRKINGVILYLDAGLQIADDAGMVYLPDRNDHPMSNASKSPDDSSFRSNSPESKRGRLENDRP